MPLKEVTFTQKPLRKPRQLQNKKSEKGKAGVNSPARALPSLSPRLQANVDEIKSVFGPSSDLVIREFKIRDEFNTDAAIIYIDGLVAKEIVNESTMKSLMLHPYPGVSANERPLKNIIENVKQHFLSVADLKEVEHMGQVVEKILGGNTVIFIQGSRIALSLGTEGWETRGVTEPTAESIVRGPREGFSETLRSNTAMIRRKIKNPRLTIESLKIGRVTKTDVAVVYIEGLANDELTAKVKYRLNQIDIDSILESGYVEELIQDVPRSFFPTIANTQRPDVVASKLLEGRVAIVVDGTPHVLTIPAIFMEYVQTAEDYYSNPLYVTLIRWVRMLALATAAFLPSLYVAITSYHAVMIPTPLLLTLAAAREGIPFPSIVEALLMGITFEGLREAGIRMPRPVGPAVSIVGALVIGEAAIQAGIASAGMVIIVSVTAIASFIIPYAEVANALVPIRLIMLIPAGVLGLYGLLLGIILVAVHLVTLESFGVPYFSPIAPLNIRALKDTIIRVPWWAMNKRCRYLGNKDAIRQYDAKDYNGESGAK